MHPRTVCAGIEYGDGLLASVYVVFHIVGRRHTPHVVVAPGNAATGRDGIIHTERVRGGVVRGSPIKTHGSPDDTRTTKEILRRSGDRAYASIAAPRLARWADRNSDSHNVRPGFVRCIIVVTPNAVHCRLSKVGGPHRSSGRDYLDPITLGVQREVSELPPAQKAGGIGSVAIGNGSPRNDGRGIVDHRVWAGRKIGNIVHVDRAAAAPQSKETATAKKGGRLRAWCHTYQRARCALQPALADKQRKKEEQRRAAAVRGEGAELLGGEVSHAFSVLPFCRAHGELSTKMWYKSSTLPSFNG